MEVPELHPDLGPVAFLLGRWHGEARSLWLGDEIVFREETVFEHFGKPWISYRQQTWRADGLPSHGESGYLAVKPDGSVTLTIAQPSGVVEVSTGRAEGGRVEVDSARLALSEDAKPVTGVARSIFVEDEGVLAYLLRVSLNGEPLADHIAGRLLVTAS